MTRSLAAVAVAALLGLAIAAGLSYGVSVATSENSLLSGASPDAGLELAPGKSGMDEVRTPRDKPVVVTVGPGGDAVVESQGGPQLIPGDSGNSSQYARQSRGQDD